MRRINRIILHCSATSAAWVRISNIREWHIQRGFTDVGYHYFIGTDGRLEWGRPLEKVGAHCKGYNRNSVGICLNGLLASDFTPEQFTTLGHLLTDLRRVAPDATLHGHREFASKECPVFDYGDFKKAFET